ncbi:unnamed protein product, partial [Discosporangium mesarthrocarpum]
MDDIGAGATMMPSRRDSIGSGREVPQELELGAVAQHCSNARDLSTSKSECDLLLSVKQGEDMYDPKQDKRATDSTPSVWLCGFFCCDRTSMACKRRARSCLAILGICLLAVWFTGWRAHQQHRILRRKLVRFLQDTAFQVKEEGIQSPRWHPPPPTRNRRRLEGAAEESSSLLTAAGRFAGGGSVSL